MAGRGYKARGIVLRKVKLRESDAIVTILDSEGQRLEAVAHGARRPGSSLAGRMELYSVVDVVCSSGRNLDVISDSRLVEGTLRRFGMEQSIAAAPIAELLCAIAQSGLKQERLFELAQASFAAVADAQPEDAPAFTAAALLKVCAVVGLRPQLDACVLCGQKVEGIAGIVALSHAEGGAVCQMCTRPHDAVLYDATAVAWAHALLYARYSEIASFDGVRANAFAVLELARSWIHAHVGCRMKSLDFLLACDMFENTTERT